MKLKIYILAIATLLFLGMNTSNAMAVNSFNFLGETTWNVTIDETRNNDVPIGTTFPMTGAISKLGGNYYLFQGFVQMPGDGPFVLAGGGNLLNNKLYMTLTTSQLHSDNNRDTGVMHVEINPADLSGSFYEIGHDYDRGTTFFSERFTAGTIIRTGAPINLNPSSTASLSLLLD